MESSAEMNDDNPSKLLKNTTELDISEKRSEIFRVVIIWFTSYDRSRYDTDSMYDTPRYRKLLLEWFSDENMKIQRKCNTDFHCRLQEFLPSALFENHEDNSTFAKRVLHECLTTMDNSCSNRSDGELVSRLCDLGASIIASGYDGLNPLEIALKKKRMDLVQTLIRSGSKNVAERHHCGQTILHIIMNLKFCRYNYYEYQCLVMELLSKGADVNQPDQDGVTPVHLAARKRDTELVEKFKKNGANLNCRTNHGDDVLITICKNLKKSQEDELKVLEMINLVIDSPDFCVNCKNDQGCTAFHYASERGSIEIIEHLIKAGADIHAVTNTGTNALHAAIVSSNFEVMQFLIQKNVDFRCRDSVYGFGLLHMTALNDDPRICEWLVKEKLFDVDDLSKCLLTPLHVASMLGNAGIVQKLIELGADVHCADDKFHRTALHLASMCEIDPQALILKDFRANGDEIENGLVDEYFNYYWFLGDKINFYASTFALLDAGADVDALDNKCLTPLQYSVVNYKGTGLINLLTFGANINDISHEISREICHKLRNHDSAKIAIVEHLLKLKSAGLPVDESLKSILVNCYSIYSMRPSWYFPELAKMKKRMLTDEVSLYDVLHMSFKRRSTFANSLPRDIEREFPNYFVILKGRCYEAVNRIALLGPAIEAFQWMTGMPHVCVDNILSFMSNLSLRVLIDAANVTK